MLSNIEQFQGFGWQSEEEKSTFNKGKNLSIFGDSNAQKRTIVNEFMKNNILNKVNHQKDIDTVCKMAQQHKIAKEKEAHQEEEQLNS